MKSYVLFECVQTIVGHKEVRPRRTIIKKKMYFERKIE